MYPFPFTFLRHHLSRISHVQSTRHHEAAGRAPTAPCTRTFCPCCRTMVLCESAKRLKSKHILLLVLRVNVLTIYSLRVCTASCEPYHRQNIHYLLIQIIQNVFIVGERAFILLFDEV